MTEQFVLYQMMQFQKFKHFVAKYFETKSMAKKINKHLWHTGPFIQMNICFLLKRKIGNRQLNGLAYNSMV